MFLEVWSDFFAGWKEGRSLDSLMFGCFAKHRSMIKDLLQDRSFTAVYSYASPFLRSPRFIVRGKSIDCNKTLTTSTKKHVVVTSGSYSSSIPASLDWFLSVRACNRAISWHIFPHSVVHRRYNTPFHCFFRCVPVNCGWMTGRSDDHAIRRAKR
jgi:hypothetical protein